MPALDVLRSAAVFMVLTGHFAEIGMVKFRAFSDLFDSPIFRFGWTGVDLFFVLSGFLIGRQLWKEVAASGTVKYRRFILRRGFRIWPLYLVFVVLSPILSGTGHYLASDWLFLSNYRWGNVGGGWSLSTEEQFYLLAPLAVLAVARWVRPRIWLYILPLVLGAVSLVRMLTADEMLRHGLSIAAVKTALYSPFHLRNEGLVIGLLLALVSVLRPEFILRRERTPVRRVVLIASAAIGVGLGLRTMNNIVFPFLGLGLAFGGVMVLLLMCGGIVKRVLAWRPFYVVSRLSYGMYLNHFPIVQWLVPPLAVVVMRHIGATLPAVILVFVLMVALSLTISAVLYVAVERPFLQARDAVLDLRGNPARDPAGAEAPAGAVAV